MCRKGIVSCQTKMKICRNQTKNRGKIKGEEQNYLRKHRNLVRRRGKTRGCRTGISRRWNFLTWSFRLYRGKIRIIRCRPRRFRRCRRPAVEMEGDQTARIDRTDREDFLGDSGRRSRCIRFRSSREIYREAQTTVPLIVRSVF